MYKNIRIHILILLIATVLFSCKKGGDNIGATIITVDKGAALFDYQTSFKDTLYVTRDKLTAYFRVSANTQNLNVEMKRLYIFKRNLDNPSTPAVYTSVEGVNNNKDAHDNYYYKIPSASSYNSSSDISVYLRAYDKTAIEEEYFFVYTTDADYTDPSSTDGIVIGPIQFYVKYGKLVEYKGLKLYNHAYNDSIYFSNYDVVNLGFLYQIAADADVDISEKTANTQLFLGKFKARNNTTFVKAPANFPYSNATDTEVAKFYSEGTPFSETPDSIKIGEVYLMKIRDAQYQYAAMKILYIVPENGKVGLGYNSEYFLFNLKK
ncbi:hypothetical protein [uncultured Cytophaga sp.]|uniref:hypothetical protein n=1 Tax=uncultured Cytophaga sp. TaxID=160238 RepID=UPI00260E02EF|nr:hypothetical protein [uncultured Cytophaga sp.]